MPDEAEVSDAPSIAPSRPWRAARRFVLIVGLVLVGFLGSLYAVQANVIFPGSSTQGRPEAVVRAGPGEELVKLPTPDGEVVALFGPALSADGRPLPDAAKRPALVFFYGNAMCLAYSRPEFDRFRRLGLNVVIPDFLGYGMSGGEPSEIGCRQTAEACHAFLRSRGFPAGRILVGGWSLGGAVAIDLASRKEVAGLFALSTFTSMRDMARTVLPIAPPAFLFKHKFNSLDKIKSIRRPILLGHGRRDPIVPFAMLGRLAAACPRPPTIVVLDRAGHNDFLDQGGARLDRAIQDLAARAADDSPRP
mgnify:CR=1 FL=1